MLAWLLAATDVSGRSTNPAAAGTAGAAGPSCSAAPQPQPQPEAAGGSSAAGGSGSCAGGSGTSRPAAAPGGGETVWERQAPLLHKLGLLSHSGRYGPALIQLSYALVKAGDRDLGLHLLRRALPPTGLPFDAVPELRPWHIGALKELLPLAAKYGSEEVRRDAAVARLLVLRLPLEVADVGDEGVVAHVLEVMLRLYRGFFAQRHMDVGFEELATQAPPYADPYTGYGGGGTSREASNMRAAHMLQL